MKQLLGGQGLLLDLSTPQVMGILNLTSDSFYSGSRVKPENFMPQAESMIEAGAAILDLGAMSSRPGAEIISPEVEWKRLEPAISTLRKSFPNQYLSVDTLHAETADKAGSLGVHMVNDISGGLYSPTMLEVVAKHRMAFVAMHMPGTPETMQIQTQYPNGVVIAVQKFFSDRIMAGLEFGLNDVVLDPGFGFGKTMEQNYQLAQGFDQLLVHQKILLAGVSRKSMVYRPLKSSPEKALNATTALHMPLLHRGAKILRVHDVAEAREAIKIFTFVQNPASCSS